MISTHINGNFAGSYIDISSIPNYKEIVGVEYLGNFYNPFWNGSEWIENATDEEVQQNYILEAKKNETELYKKRQIDGVNAYAEISAEFRLAKLSGLLSEEQHGAIESVLIPVRNEVLAGQWISARNILEEIGTSIGSELYDRLHSQITNYINENY